MLKKKETGNPRAAGFVILMAACLCGIYGFTDLKGSYYQVIRSALSLSDAQLGRVWSAFGLTAMVSYVFGGYLADRVSELTIIRCAVLFSAILHLLFSFLPPYPVQIVLSGLMGVAAVLAFFPASIKLLTAIGEAQSGSRGSGNILGLYYGIGGVLAFALQLIVSQIYAQFTDDVWAFVFLMRAYALLNLFCFALFFLVPVPKVQSQSRQKESASAYRQVAARRDVWLIALIILCSYTAFRAMTYITPYLTDVFRMPEAQAIRISVLRMGLLLPAASYLFGRWCLKRGRSSDVIRKGFVLLALSCALILLNDRITRSLPAALLFTTVFICTAAGIKGIALSLISEALIPYGVRGTATGIVSVIGYSPDLFLYAMVGSWMEHSGVSTYPYLFALCLALSLAGWILCRRLAFWIEKEQIDR